MQGNREEVAEYFYDKAAAQMDKSGVGIHEVSDPEKTGKGGNWLALYLQTAAHQTEMRVYGPRFIQFRVWRPFMGKKGNAQSIIFKTVEGADKFFEESLIRGIWTGKLAP